MNYRIDPSRFPEKSHKHRQDFDDDADDLWSLYGKQAKSYDEAWAKALKEDMDGVLIFVCDCFSCLTGVDVAPIPGWFILCCSRRLRRIQDSGLEREPRRSVGLLPEPDRSDT
jgi:hypothetical protein